MNQDIQGPTASQSIQDSPLDPLDETQELDVPPMANSTALWTLCLLALLLCIAGDALAQGGWNRKLESTAILPTGQGSEHEVHVVWTVSVEPSTVPLDLSTVIEVFANGTLLTSQIVVGSIDAGSLFCGAVPCNGSCGTGYFDGVFQGALLCYLDGPPPTNDCDCGQRITIGLDDPISLQPGDEIMVLLRPAPGALPEPDTSDDFQRFDFHGGTQFWNRSVDVIELTPIAGTPNRYDIEVRGFVEWDGMDGVEYLPLSFYADLEVNGVRVARQLVTQEAEPGVGSCFYLGCGAYCGVINGLSLDCNPLHFLGCVCGGGWIGFFPDTDWDEGDDLQILLRPAPGTLPELPGFEEDDEIRPPDETSSTDLRNVEAPARLRLAGPNPVSRGDMSRISLDVERPTYIRLEIIDAQGRSIRTLADSMYPSGSFNWDWNGRTDSGQQVATGVYFAAAWVDNRPQVEKLLIVQ